MSAVNLVYRASVIEPIISSGSQKSVAPHLPTVHDFIHIRISLKITLRILENKIRWHGPLGFNRTQLFHWN